ncbi:MAG: DUF2188 domain-containing protein [Acidocella sp.]|jgi:hypothetical protein|nr:DUF2188 domain-containing protein [Acidocella sp.]OYV50743.1 MAG: hypothetical protein B7Z77_05230 [Acidocella sp. 20-58-15]OYY05840.1 MAG: hypothetical protein B7Y73_00560 [Acidocella sp. 35-58-6]
MIIHYKVVAHDGGWAYRLGEVFSETYPTHQAALKAAKRVAREQHVPGETRYIQYQNEAGEWVTELSHSLDTPEAEVEG